MTEQSYQPVNEERRDHTWPGTREELIRSDNTFFETPKGAPCSRGLVNFIGALPIDGYANPAACLVRNVVRRSRIRRPCGWGRGRAKGRKAPAVAGNPAAMREAWLMEGFPDAGHDGPFRFDQVGERRAVEHREKGAERLVQQGPQPAGAGIRRRADRQGSPRSRDPPR